MEKREQSSDKPSNAKKIDTLGHVGIGLMSGGIVLIIIFVILKLTRSPAEKFSEKGVRPLYSDFPRFNLSRPTEPNPHRKKYVVIIIFSLLMIVPGIVMVIIDVLRHREITKIRMNKILSKGKKKHIELT